MDKYGLHYIISFCLVNSCRLLLNSAEPTYPNRRLIYYVDALERDVFSVSECVCCVCLMYICILCRRETEEMYVCVCVCVFKYNLVITKGVGTELTNV